MGTVAVNLLQEKRTRAVNKVQQGLLNSHRIMEVIREFPATTATLIEYETGLRLKTIQHQLQQLSHRGEIFEQQRGMGEEFLYREAGKGRVKQTAHLLSTAEAWAALRKGARAVGLDVEDELPKQFASSHGTTEPDLVFSLRARTEPKKFYTWEEDLGSERGKKDFFKKLVCMWWWRHEQCRTADGTTSPNVWGIRTITMLTNTTTDRHMEKLRSLVRPAHPEGKISLMFLFTSRERWSRKNATELFTAPIWFSAKENMPRRLVE